MTIQHLLQTIKRTGRLELSGRAFKYESLSPERGGKRLVRGQSDQRQTTGAHDASEIVAKRTGGIA